MKTKKSARNLLSIVLIALVTVGSGFSLAPAKAAACQLSATDYGTATVSLTIPSTGTYRLWSHIMSPSPTNNTYLLEVDGATCYNVGGGSIPPSTWTWVDYQGGDTNSKIQQSLNQGSHTFKFIGNQPGLKLDRILAFTNLGCSPSGQGDNCNQPNDTTPPTVSLTAPADGALVSGSVKLTATANDNVGVTKVEFYDNSMLVGSSITPPYNATWDTTKTPNGSHLITARAYDAAGNVSLDSRTLTVQNGQRQTPTAPSNVVATTPAYNKVVVSWSPSTKNVGATSVTGYTITRNGTPLATVKDDVTSYQDVNVAPGTAYDYQVNAYSDTDNKIALSPAVTVSIKTPSAPDTQPPTAPTSLTANAFNSSQINLSWSASTDNVGVTGYDVYRGTTKIATITTTTFGDSGLQASGAYSYYVKARDAAGNVSQPSITVKAVTKAWQTQTFATIKGKVTDSQSGKAIPGGKIIVPLDKNHKNVTYTSKDGDYSLTLRRGGRYSVSYNKRGYISQSFSLSLSDNNVLTRDVALIKK